MKRPVIKDYCKPFSFDPSNKDLVSFDSKGYSRAASKYIDYLLSHLTALANEKATPLKVSSKIYSIITN